MLNMLMLRYSPINISPFLTHLVAWEFDLVVKYSHKQFENVSRKDNAVFQLHVGTLSLLLCLFSLCCTVINFLTRILSYVCTLTLLIVNSEYLLLSILSLNGLQKIAQYNVKEIKIYTGYESLTEMKV